MFLLDGHYLFYRSYHAMSEANLTDGQGRPTGAVYGFARFLLSLIDQYDPDYLVCAMDSEEPTFRHELYEEYKLERPEMPEDLVEQIPLMEDLLERFGVPVEKEAGFECDDLLASMVQRWRSRDDLGIVVVSNDKDNFQLVGNGVKVLKQKRGLTDVEMLDEEGVEDQLGVPPEQVQDYLCLVGDSIDNIPGIRGIGSAYASRILEQAGNLDNLLEDPDRAPERFRDKIRDHLEQLEQSRELVRLRTDAPLDLELEEAVFEQPDPEKLVPLFQELEFRSLLEELQDQMDVTPGWDEVEPEVHQVQLGEEFRGLPGDGPVAGYLETVPLDERWSTATEVRLVVAAGESTVHVYRIPLDDPNQEVLDHFQALREKLRDREINLFTQKHLQRVAIRLEQEPFRGGYGEDLQLCSYLADADQAHELNDVITAVTDTMVPDRPDQATGIVDWHGRRALLLLRSREQILRRLDQRDQRSVYEELEHPLTWILAAMEHNGIFLDTEVLSEMQQALQEKLNQIEEEAYEVAGQQVNLNSPKQLRNLLFEELDLPVQGRTDTGKPSTDADTLEALADHHELPGKILDHRQYKKILSTYVEPLLEARHPETGRVHTEFHQAVTGTGRLSSSRPNLQNIPVRDEYGRQVRKAFAAPEGWLLLGADYSQVELRLLAHLSQDETLLEAFREGQDVHELTAQRVGEALEETQLDRRMAKVVNYGITYGLSAHGLSNDLDVSEGEAQAIIDQYFERYPGVQRFIDQTKQQAHDQGYVETLWGRRRYLAEINSNNPYRRQFAERAAVNAPLQGTAADMMKRAMIDLMPRLEDREARLLLQVHDELILEAPEGQIEDVSDLVGTIMEDVVDLRVPTPVTVETGSTWAQASK